MIHFAQETPSILYSGYKISVVFQSIKQARMNKIKHHCPRLREGTTQQYSTNQCTRNARIGIDEPITHIILARNLRRVKESVVAATRPWVDPPRIDLVTVNMRREDNGIELAQPFCLSMAIT